MRFDDWQARLAHWLVAEAGLPFDEADRHCGWFAADAVLVMTGQDMVAHWRGRHKTMGGALRALRRAGYQDHVALVASLLPEVHPAFALPGDVMVLPELGGAALGILQGVNIYTRGRDGIMNIDRMQAIRAFRVI